MRTCWRATPRATGCRTASAWRCWSARLEEQAGAAVPALRKVFRELRAARTAAIAAASGGGGG
ncbi:hypothetical protein [Amycolatopsis sp. lyj-109]|uniref:hypothetical protein n=1 Tax=Amycolatopsis sp. lyj-109 TaxID=2789287 RepID=UPI00397D857A